MTLLLQGAGIQALTVAPSGPVPLLDLEADTGVLTDVLPFAGTGTITQSGTTVQGIGTLVSGEIVTGDRITAAGIDGIVQGLDGLFTERFFLDTSAEISEGVPFTITPQATTARVNQWVDQGSGECDVFATGTARPYKTTFNGYAALAGDDVDDGLTSVKTDVADNMDSFTLIYVGVLSTGLYGAALYPINKIDTTNDWIGWLMDVRGLGAYINNASSGVGSGTSVSIPNDNQSHIFTFELLSRIEGHWYMDGSNANESTFTAAAFQYGNSQPIRVCYQNDGTHDFGVVHAFRIYSPALSSSDRAAVEAELAARYGITL